MNLAAAPPDVPCGSFTLILPVFNRQEAAVRALASVYAQDLLPAEVVVVDDGSAEPFEPPLPPAGVSLRLIRHAHNRGAAAARNTGLKAAGKAWVTFLDSDDRLMPRTLATRFAAVGLDTEAPSVETVVHGCGWEEVDPEGRVLARRLPRPASDVAAFASGCWFCPGSCVFVNRDFALRASNGQDEDLPRFEDYDWFLALALAGATLSVIPVVAVAIERRRTQRPDQVRAATAAIERKWAAHPLSSGIRRRLRAYLALENGSACFYAGRRAAAAAFLVRSFLAVPRLSLHLSPGWTRPPEGA